MKTWLHNKYADLYVDRPKMRCIISINAPFRFLLNGCWRKGGDGLELYSPATGAFFEYNSTHDVSLLSNNFVRVRVVVVVKDGTSLVQKLVLLTSKTQLIVAAHMNSVFDKNHNNNWHTTLFLAMSAQDKPTISINVFPKDKSARQYVLKYNEETKKFQIPSGLDVNANARSDEYGGSDDLQTNPQLAGQPDMGAQCLELVEYDAQKQKRVSMLGTESKSNVNRANSNCTVCLGVDHSSGCQKGVFSSCHECHLIIRNIGDHAEGCTAKQWFVSGKIEAYVKIPSIRMVILFASPISILLKGIVQVATPGLKLFSPMSDSYFKFASDKELIVQTTGYTRIRLPIIVEERQGIFTEKLVIFTSSDRAVVIAKGTRRIFDESAVLSDFVHSTPLALYMLKNGFNFVIKVYSAGGAMNVFDLKYQGDVKKFEVPAPLDVKSTELPLMKFDAAFNPLKRK